MNIIFQDLISQKIPPRLKRFIFTGLLLALCLAFLERYQILNGFTILPGDRYDAVISTAILEHWFHFFTGNAKWSEVNYFFPYTRTIAQTDAYFLVGIAYTPFRIFGFDPFLSSDFASLIIKSTGFIGIYVICRKFFSFSFYWALIAAILFTLSNGMTIHSSRIQLDTVAFAPIFAILIWNMIKEFLYGNPAKFKRWGVAAGMFYGAWCLTCFYMAWFFTFFFSVFVVTMLIMSGQSGRSLLKERLVALYGSVLFVVGASLVSISPFVYAFLPKSFQVGVRPYASVSHLTVPLAGILQVGKDNLLFGKLYNYILSHICPSYLPKGEYYDTGFSIILFLFFIFGCVQFLRDKRDEECELVLKSLVITTLITWPLILRISGHSAWFFVYHLFPGAKALNVVAAYQIFLAFPVVIIAIKYFSKLRMALPVILMLSAMLIVGEINHPYLALDRQAELKRISLPNLPPKACHVFYTSGWKGQDRLGPIGEMYAHNVTAMFLAQIAGIPTINGIASFNPPDWNFSFPDKPDYDERMLQYAKKHNISGLCKLNLNTKMWVVVKDYSIKRQKVAQK